MKQKNFLRNVIATAICLVGLTASVSAWAQDVMQKKNFGGSDFDYYYSVTAVSDGVVAAGVSGSSSFGTGDWAGVARKGGYDAILVKYSIDTGIEQVKTDVGELKIYPNPVKDELTIKNGELTIENYVVADMTGQVVMKGNPQNTNVAINVSALPKGVYMVKVYTAQGVATAKIIKT